MDRLKLIQRVRGMTRDFSNSIFREADIIDWINEGIERFAQVIPELRGLEALNSNSSTPTLIPKTYRHLLAVYSTARCFAQDERHYQASTYMNEFEVKLDELKNAIEAGDIVILDENGDKVTFEYNVDYVNLEPYWNVRGKTFDFDEGVEGVE